MTGWRARRRFARLVADIPAPTASDCDALCRAVAERLDRPIHLLPLPLPPDVPCGLVITTPNAHHVAYDNRTSPLHQRHIVAHELGHLLAGHTGQPVGGTDLARLLMPTLDPAVVTSVLGRIPGYDEQAETEAEIIADLLWRHTRRHVPPTGTANGPTADPATAAVVDRIRRSLDGG